MDVHSVSPYGGHDGLEAHRTKWVTSTTHVDILQPVSMSAPSTPRFTPQQQAAIDTRDVSVGLSAGAGCGKTFVLTQRFLSHLQPGPNSVPLSSLVAITFTERAAREMRDRVRALCHERLEHAPVEEVPHWTRIVRELDTARISTIHSFCATLLRMHAVEAELDPGFELVAESVGGSFRERTQRDFLFSRLTARDQDAEDLVYRFGLDKLRWLLTIVARDIDRVRVADWESLTDEQLAETWRRQMLETVVPAQVRELCSGPDASRLLALFRTSLPAHPKMADAARELLELLPGLAESRNLDAGLASIDEFARLHGSRVKAWSSEEDYEFAKGAMERLRKSAKKLRELLQVDVQGALVCAATGLALFRLARQAKSAYDTVKRERARLEFDDLLVKARDLLRDQPKVAARLASGIRLLMVDEFQDTDPVQVEIVRALCGGNATNGRLFFVGDAKQSIYRFRGAEPRVFAQLREELPPAGRLPLSLNFRSQPAILRFVNALFDGALDSEYEPLEPTLPQVTPEPAIEFLFPRESAPANDSQTDSLDEGAADVAASDNAASDNAASDNEDATEDEKGVTVRRKAEAVGIANRIRTWRDEGTPLVRTKDAAEGPLRPVRPRDIVLLFRAMSDVRIYEEALRDAGIDHYVIGGQAFFAQQEVFDIAHLCRGVEDTGDDIALLGALRSPMFGLADDTLLLLGMRGEGLWKGLMAGPPPRLDERRRTAVERAAAILKELRTAKDNRTIAEWLELALELTGYDATLLAERLGPRKLANVRKLLDLARDFDTAGGFSLTDFAANLAESVQSEAKEALAATHPESSDVVRLMTIHQSKGLEFPVVFVVDLDRKTLPTRCDACFDPELGPLVHLESRFGETTENLGMKVWKHRESVHDAAESLRVLYVALTRAADVLVLSGGMAPSGKPAGAWLKFLATRFELDTGKPLVNPDTGACVIPERSCLTIPQVFVHAETTTGSAGRRSDPESRSPVGFRETVATAEPGDWPPLALPLPRRFGPDWRVSVSELEAALGAIASAESWFFGAGKASIGFIEHVPARSRGAKSTEVDAEQLGTLVHAALELVPLEPTVDPISIDVEALVVSAWGRTDRPLPDPLRAAAVDQTERWLASPLFGELLRGGTVQREIPFLLSRPAPEPLTRRSDVWSEVRRTTVSGTIDLLYRHASGDPECWRILDYKTSGPIRPGDAPSMLARYELQLGLYCMALEQWLGLLPERISLVLLRDAVQEVHFQPTRDFLEHTARLCDRAFLAAALLTENVDYPPPGRELK
jgi:ATP-dependent helicase/nuclease subunit A